MILQGAPTPGTDMREVLHLNDVVIDFKITANRPDCQSVLGVAREIAVALQVPFRGPVPTYITRGGDINEHIRRKNTCFNLCNTVLAQTLAEILIKSVSLRRRCGIGERGAVTLFDVGTQSKLRNNKNSAADIENAFIHFSVFIFKDTQFGNLGSKQFRLRLTVAIHNTEQNVISLADAAFYLTVNGNG
jgi:hypothetical protein